MNHKGIIRSGSLMVKQSSRVSDSISATYRPDTRLTDMRELSDAAAVWTPGPRPRTDLEEVRIRFKSGPLHEMIL